jgi:hypothetical protein
MECAWADRIPSNNTLGGGQAEISPRKTPWRIKRKVSV